MRHRHSGLFRHELPRTQYFAKLTLDILCDIQVITGTSILVAGFVQINTMTFYHQQFVINYWLLTLNSFWAARAGNLNQSDENGDWHSWSRTAAIFVTIVLSTVFQLIVVPWQANGTEPQQVTRSKWNPVKSGFCYISHDSAEYDQQYLWIAGLIIYAAYLFLVLISGILYFIGVRPRKRPNHAEGGNQTWMEKISFDIKRREETHRKRYKEWKDKKTFVGPAPAPAGDNGMQRPTVSQDVAKYHLPKLLHYSLEAVLRMPLVFWWIIRRFFALLAWGDSRSLVLVLSYCGFAAWSSYDIIDMKKSNTYLVQNEAAWGFGQVLPVVLILLIFLNILDAIKG